MVADPVKRVKVDEATQAKGATEDSTAKRHKRGKKTRGKKKGIDAGMSASAAGTSAAEIQGYLEVATASSNCCAAQRPCADTLHVPYRASALPLHPPRTRLHNPSRFYEHRAAATLRALPADAAGTGRKRRRARWGLHSLRRR
jgi:hypothetical protein